MSSATGCRRSLRFRTIQNQKLKIQSSSSPASPRCCKKLFPPGEIAERTRAFGRGGKIAPLDLIEFLEEQGYEPEAQVSQKGEIALRGGIVDIFPPTSPWPVCDWIFLATNWNRCASSTRSRKFRAGEISTVILPPAGELGILKNRRQDEKPLATLLDHLPRETIFLLCEPDSLAVHAENYAGQIPKGDPFFISCRICWSN